jgi:hypothetical protein
MSAVRGQPQALRSATFAVLLAGYVTVRLARPLRQTAFPSPEGASGALFAAVQTTGAMKVTAASSADAMSSS